MKRKKKPTRKTEEHQIIVKTGDQVNFYIGDQKINKEPVESMGFITVKLDKN